jgi:hypothetical protein
MTHCEELKPGYRVRVLQGGMLKGLEGIVVSTCMSATTTKLNPEPKSTQVWVRFDDPKVGEQHDIYDYQLERLTKVCSNCDAQFFSNGDGGSHLVFGRTPEGANIAPIWNRQSSGPSQQELYEANICPCCERQTLI